MLVSPPWLCLGSSAFFLRYLFGLAWFSQTTSCFPFHVIVFVFFSPADPRWVIHIHIYIKNIKMVLILKKMVVLLMSVNLYFIVKYRRTKYLFLIFFMGSFGGTEVEYSVYSFFPYRCDSCNNCKIKCFEGILILSCFCWRFLTIFEHLDME